MVPNPRRSCAARLVGLPFLVFILTTIGAAAVSDSGGSQIGREVAVAKHLQDGDETRLSIREILAKGQELFNARWTSQEGGGRPLTKGTGNPLSDPSKPLVFPRNFNRISGPDSGSCAACHNSPFGIAGGAGDVVANVFVLGQRFDFANFDAGNVMPTVDSVDERGLPVTLGGIADSRITIGMFGSGYIEMLSRQVTADLQRTRDSVPAGGSQPLVSKGLSFGTLSRRADGTWDVSRRARMRLRRSSFDRSIRPPTSSRCASSRTTPSTTTTAFSRRNGSAKARTRTATASWTSSRART
jgi:hypothetical protein